jgi:hypothetical protein
MVHLEQQRIKVDTRIEWERRQESSPPHLADGKLTIS